MASVDLTRGGGKVDVLVIGAGPAGLVAGITLGGYGVDVLVVDKRAEPSQFSRALVVSTRGMELMRQWGIEDDVRAGAADVGPCAWVTPNLASGEGAEMPLGYPTDAEAAAVSPSRPAWAPQDHHEPILLDLLRSRASAAVELGWEVTSVSQDEYEVRATLVEVATGAERQLSAAYAVVADGARSRTRDQLGIAMVGPDELEEYERVEFIAPLSSTVGDRRYALNVITGLETSAVLAQRGSTDRWGLNRERRAGEDGFESLSADALVDLIRRATGVPALEPVIERIVRFPFAAQLADRYRDGRAFLVGDAAHRMTPRGGTGMNTAIQDAFDIGWKVAWVLQGWAGEDLTDSYEDERRPTGRHNVERAGSPGGARQPAIEALPWDLYGRLPHHWVDADRTVSTVDLVGDRLTVFAGPGDPRWSAIGPINGSGAPVDVRTVDAATAEALGLDPMGAMLVRPDGREVGRWSNVDHERSVAVALGPPAVALGD